MKKVMQTLSKRLREASTWGGLSIIGLVLGLPPGTLDGLLGGLVAVTGAVAVLLPEGGA